jgi:ATP-grasp domain/L-amino acid ligase C-terminal domain 2/ATP-grasp N-terminal domain
VRKRILLFATTTGYQTRAFGEAAQRLDADLVFATDRCSMLEDPWQDSAVPIRFHDEPAAVAAILAASRTERFDGILAVGDRPTGIAARVAAALNLPWHPPAAAAAARNKRLTRERLKAAGLPAPWFAEHPLDVDPAVLEPSLPFPCVIKPLALSGSRGVMRINDGDDLRAALDRLRTLLASPDIRAERNAAHGRILIEGFIPGHEYAIEGVMNHGALDVLAIFDKPDPLDGPFFEETIYITPAPLSTAFNQQIATAVGQAAASLGLHHGPIHAECRVGEQGIFVLEVAARPIGGLCARALRFNPRPAGNVGPISLEELLLRHALGESSLGWIRESDASGVMMIPIPRRGVLRAVAGIEDASGTTLVEEVRITAKPDQMLIPLPEGASYLGFIFARGADGAAVTRALREAHRRLVFTIDSELRVLQSVHG